MGLSETRMAFRKLRTHLQLVNLRERISPISKVGNSFLYASLNDTFRRLILCSAVSWGVESSTLGENSPAERKASSSARGATLVRYWNPMSSVLR